jgi:hypothetical protein
MDELNTSYFDSIYSMYLQVIMLSEIFRIRNCSWNLNRLCKS